MSSLRRSAEPRGLVPVLRLVGVPVRLHWSLLLGSAFVLLFSLEHLWSVLFAIVAYFAAMLIHEWGHVLLARRYRCHVYAVDLYPLVGLTRFERPGSPAEHAAIAWGGVLLQGAVALPALAWFRLAGPTGREPLDAFLGVFVHLSAFMVVWNLLPIPPLDGAVAWPGVPSLIRGFLALRARKRGRGWNARR